MTREQVEAAEAALFTDPAVAVAIVAKARAAKSAKEIARAVFPEMWLRGPSSCDKDQRHHLSVILDGHTYSVPVEVTP